MYFRKLAFVMATLALAPIAQADSGDDTTGSLLHGPLSVCLGPSIALYPCISLTPSLYSSGLGGASSYDGSPLPGLPQDYLSTHLFTFSIKHRDSSSLQWHTLRRFEGMDFNFNLDHTGAGMNMDMGGLEFNVILDEGEDTLVEPRFFLGIDRAW
ncbi:MAG: hypothetical protein AABZ84_00140 [Pseudomonadota bacterium]